MEFGLRFPFRELAGAGDRYEYIYVEQLHVLPSIAISQLQWPRGRIYLAEAADMFPLPPRSCRDRHTGRQLCNRYWRRLHAE